MKRTDRGMSSWKKFKLLMWKNVIIIWRRKFQTMAEIIIPIFFCMLLVYLRNLVEKENKVQHFEFAELDTFFNGYGSGNDTQTLAFWKVWYAPHTKETEKIMRYTQYCMSLNAIEPFSDPLRMVKNFIHEEQNRPLAAVIFDLTSFNAANKTRLNVTIRFPGELREEVLDFADRKYSVLGMNWATDKLMPPITIGGPRNYWQSNGGSPPGYMPQKFVFLQSCLSTAYIEVFILGRSIKLDEEFSPQVPVSVLRYTHPPVFIDWLLDVFRTLVPLMIFMSYLYPCMNNIELIVLEKESQLKETMKIMGVASWINWCAWYIKIMVSLTATATIETVLLSMPCTGDATSSVFFRSAATPIWVFLICYNVACASFCLMMSAMFNTTSMCNTITALVWFLFYIPYNIVDHNEENMSSLAKLLVCAFHNTALPLGLRTILKHEANGAGLQWHKFFANPDVGHGAVDTVSIGHIAMVQLVAGASYLVIALYMDCVHPGDFGVAKPWYFPISFLWRVCERQKRLKLPPPHPLTNAFIETVRGRVPGMELENITKAYKKNRVVLNGINLTLYKDEITVILGENGAGKTTLMSIMSGVISPSGGYMYLEGKNITRRISAVQHFLGFCPQHNILFDQLTVREHIIFFALMKGFPLKNVEREVRRYVEKLGLEDKIDAEARTLSGGMKRKVSLAVALCGGSQIVFCDEPTSGIDPMARRMIWDLLREEKKNRTILLSTHFMDEADVLADRVAILYDGRIRSYGSPLFLKNAYHTGYILHCEKGPRTDEQQVLKLLQSHVPRIKTFNNVATELSYKLDAEHAEKYEVILRDLENNSKRLGLLGLGISQSTLEEIFLFVTNPTTFQSNAKRPLNIRSLGNPKENSRSWNLYVSHIGAMFIKKTLLNFRRHAVLLSQLIVPPIMLAIFVLIARTAVPKSELPPLPMTLEPYRKVEPVIVLSDNTMKTHRVLRNVANQFKQLVNESGAELMEVLDLPRYIEALPINSMIGFNKRHIFGLRVTGEKLVAMFNNEYFHTMPLSLNYLYNAYTKSLNWRFSISITSHPLPLSAVSKFDLMTSYANMGFWVVLAIGFAMGFMSAFYITLVVKERVTRFKLMQLVSGVNLWIYWFTTFLFDYATFSFIVTTMLATLFLYDEDGFNTLPEVLRMAMLFACFIWAILPWIYCLSMLFDSPTTGFLFVFQLAIFFGNSLHFLMKALRSPSLNMPDKADFLMRMCYIVPFFTIINGLTNINNLNQYIPMCSAICDSHEFCMKPVLICYTGRTYSEKCCILDFYSWEDPGIMWDIVMLMVSGLIGFVLLFVIEFKVLSNLLSYTPKNMPRENKRLDSEVLGEKVRIRSLPKDRIGKYGLVAKDLCKFYGEHFAVKRLCLTIANKECFGLLGLNGAGKTTTFRMMAGDLRISSGNVWVRGYNVAKQLSQAYLNIGYCPQFDALFGELTGRETLTMFLMMCGTPMTKTADIIVLIAQELNFTKHIDKQVHEYSGGNKRKLSTALSIIGAPALIYLDEPTTGMDPGAKRHLWGVLSKYQAAGKSIILTSHSMEECEALCTRLSIMVNGEFQCIGSTQHLKNKFSKGFTINILLMRDFRGPLAVAKIMTHLKQSFKNVILKESRQGMLTLFIPFGEASWSRLFGTMERAKKELHVETYSLSQTTLEQIFLAFTKHQEDV